MQTCETKKAPSESPTGLLYCLLSSLDYFLAIVVATLGADMMGELRLVALGAGYEARGLQLPVGTAAVAAGLGHFSLWNCHFLFTSGVMLIRKVSTDNLVDAEWNISRLQFSTHEAIITVFGQYCKKNLWGSAKAFGSQA